MKTGEAEIAQINFVGVKYARTGNAVIGDSVIAVTATCNEGIATGTRRISKRADDARRRKSGQAARYSHGAIDLVYSTVVVRGVAWPCCDLYD